MTLKNSFFPSCLVLFLSVKVSGPATLQAAGNASPEHKGSFTDDTFSLFRGKGLVIVRSTGEP